MTRRRQIAASLLAATAVAPAVAQTGHCVPASALGLDAGYSLQGSYQVTATRWDPLLERNWISLASCDHPERPGITVPARETGLRHKTSFSPARTSVVVTSMQPAVRAGERVYVWRQEEQIRIELSGVSEQSGEIGSTIQLELQPSIAGQRPLQIQGIVRGPAEVEMK